MVDIILGVSRPVSKRGAEAKKSGGAAGASASLPSKIDKDLKAKILERDNHTCQCCGFKSEKYQEVHFKNGDPTDFSEKNLTTTCIFCHQCFDLAKASDMRAGVLLWLPEIEQTQLHHIARAIYVARISQGPAADAARASLDVLMQRREEVRKRLGTDDPYILGSVMQDYLSPGQYKVRDKKLDGVRLFPLDRRIIKEADLEFNQFPQILAYWRSKKGPFGGKTPQQWVPIYQELKRAS